MATVNNGVYCAVELTSTRQPTDAKGKIRQRAYCNGICKYCGDLVPKELEKQGSSHQCILAALGSSSENLALTAMIYRS